MTTLGAITTDTSIGGNNNIMSILGVIITGMWRDSNNINIEGL